MVTSKFLFVVEDWWGAYVTVWNKSWAFRQKNSICRMFGTNFSLGLMLIGLFLLSSWVSDTNQRPGLICSIMMYGLESPCCDILPPCGHLGNSALCIFPMRGGSEKQYVTDFPGFRIPSTILRVLFIIYRLFHWSSNVCEALQPQRRVSYLTLSFFKVTSAHIADGMAEREV